MLIKFLSRFKTDHLTPATVLILSKRTALARVFVCQRKVQSRASHKHDRNWTYLIHVNKPRIEKTCLRVFRPGRTQTGLYSHRKNRDGTIYVAKTKGLSATRLPQFSHLQNAGFLMTWLK